MSNEQERRAILFCLCGPSGSGKSTICREILKRDTQLKLSCSTTTRKPRPGERDGIDYHFVTKDEFQLRIASGAFIEHAVFNGQQYGTERQTVEAGRRLGVDLMFDIDVQGVKNLKQICLGDVVTIFVCPPSMKILEERLVARGAENKEEIKARLQTAKKEIAVLRQPTFSDYLLVNSDMRDAVLQALQIVAAERVKLARFQPQALISILGS